MTTKEKLEKALEALRRIKDNEVKNMFLDTYAAKVYEELTTPRTEPVEVKRWLHKLKVNLISDIEPRHNLDDWIELTGTYQRHIPEPTEWMDIPI